MEEALLLSRIQFGLNIGFHILFPAITIGLAWMLLYFRVRYERTRDPAWLGTYKLWVKVFALSFAMGVVSGVVMSFQFGTNWPGYMNSVGNIAGPLLAYEVLTAFFLEATFLGVMLFGMNRVPGWVHVLSAGVVAFGTTVSAFWILALNSWMQTPAGPRGARRRAHRRKLARGDLQSLVPVSPRAHAARLGHHRVVPRGRAFGLAPAEGAGGPLRAQDAALRRARRRRAGADPGRRRRPARAQHARAPAGEDRRDGGAVADASAARRSR